MSLLENEPIARAGTNAVATQTSYFSNLNPDIWTSNMESFRSVNFVSSWRARLRCFAIVAFAVMLTFDSRVLQAEQIDKIAIFRSLKSKGISCIETTKGLQVVVGNSQVLLPSRIDPSALQLLSKIGRIDSIFVERVGGLPEEDYEFLTKIESLRYLEVQWQFGDVGQLISFLGECRELQSICVNVGDISSDDFAALGNCRTLRHISISCANMSEEHILKFATTSHDTVESLCLISSGTYQPAMRELESLASLAKLRLLDIDGSKLSDSEKARLRKTLANCDIRFVDEVKID